MTTIALCIPHTPWMKERRASMARLREQIEAPPEGFVYHDEVGGPQHYRELTDRAPNAEWSVTMWRWMLETGADFCLTLQDDVIAAPCFWPALRAMLPQLPRGHLLGLSGVHPMAREVARRGHRWYRTTSWVIGWAYGMWRPDIEAFLTWRLSEEGEAFTKAISPNGEDAVLNHWVGLSRRDTWHPVPTIVDHDVSLDSNYAQNEGHGHRRPWVTWHEYPDAQLVRPDFWLVNGKAPQHLHTVPQNACWWCGERQPVAGSQKTGAQICGVCLGDSVRAVLGMAVVQ